MKYVTVDFETQPIINGSPDAPEPVGVSVQTDTMDSPKYYSWGHPTENNCDFGKGRSVIQKIWKSKLPILFHNAKFDVSVAEQHCGVQRLDWRRYHDTMFLVFLSDPHAPSFGLKESAERILKIPPEEKDALVDWLYAHGYIKSKNQKNAGEFISKAPGDLVGDYARGDVYRTKRLFEHLMGDIIRRGMEQAYDRERELMPILLDSERQGVRLDTKLLHHDIGMYHDARGKAEVWLKKRLDVDEINFDSTAEVAKVLDDRGIVTEWVLTKTGKKSTAKDNLTIDMYNDPQVAYALGYINRLGTCLGTFMEPWATTGRSFGGRIYPSWNQVRQPKAGSESKGTRTGRLSCMNPNFMNMPQDFTEKGDGYKHPDFLNVPELPLVRRYVLPDSDDHVIAQRDYSQQELRILAHYENDALLGAYHDDPDLDVHLFVQQEIKRITGIDVPRGKVKIMNFGKIYGQGLASLAAGMNVSIEEVRAIRNAQNMAVPGLPDLEKEIKALGKSGAAIRTWGGREYYVEEPVWWAAGNKYLTFEYKLLNYLIQGSAADCTKQSIINYERMGGKRSRFMITVHDENNISAPKKYLKEEMLMLKQAMEMVEFDVPMKSEGKIGPCWGVMKPYDKV